MRLRAPSSLKVGTDAVRDGKRMVVEAMSQLSPQALEALRRCHMPGGHSGAIGLLEAALSRYECTHTVYVERVAQERRRP